MNSTKLYTLLVIALVAMTGCAGKDDNPAATADQPASVVNGYWYAEVAEQDEAYDIRYPEELMVATYDHIGILVYLEDGGGLWTHYYLKDGELVNYDGHYYEAWMTYRVAYDGRLSFIAEQDDEGDRSTPLDAFGLRYTGSQLISEPVNGTTLTFRRLGDEEMKRIQDWDRVIDADHIGLEESDYTTDVNPTHATEPSRARWRKR